MKPEQLLARVGPAVGWVVAAIASWALGKAADAHVDWLLKPSVLAPTLLVAAGLASLAWWHRTGQKADALRNTFALFKAAQELQPEDVRFQRFEPGAQLKPGFRPFHEKYFERVAVSRAEPGSISIAGEGSKSQTTWTERALVEELRAGRGVLLIGKPTEGKTRTMFEMVRALTDWMVVVPDPVKSPLDDEAFGLLEGCDVVCMIDDLNDFVGKPLDLPDFCLSASKRAQRFVIAATCRDGPEFSALAQAHLSPQRRILEMLPLQLHLQPATEADKKALRAAVPSGGDAIPTTLGSICMRGAYEMMRMRFEAFDGSTKDCHRAIQLLAVAGIRQITIGRAYCAWRSLWNRTGGVADLRDELDHLHRSGFLLSSASDDPIVPEMGYYGAEEAQVFYRDGALAPDVQTWEDVPRLVALLLKEGDLWAAYEISSADIRLGRLDRALSFMDAIAQRLASDYGDLPLGVTVAYERAWALGAVGRHQESLEAYDEVMRRSASRIMSRRGNSLRRHCSTKLSLLATQGDCRRQSTSTTICSSD